MTAVCNQRPDVRGCPLHGSRPTSIEAVEQWEPEQHADVIRRFYEHYGPRADYRRAYEATRASQTGPNAERWRAIMERWYAPEGAPA